MTPDWEVYRGAMYKLGFMPGCVDANQGRANGWVKQDNDGVFYVSPPEYATFDHANPTAQYWTLCKQEIGSNGCARELVIHGLNMLQAAQLAPNIRALTKEDEV